MTRSDNSFLPDFSHVYLESAAKKYELTNLCLDQFSNSKVVEIPDYKTVFNRPGQDFQTQKRSMKLILAVKKPPFIYKGTNMLQDGGFRNFYYRSNFYNKKLIMRNLIYSSAVIYYIEPTIQIFTKR